MTSKLTKREEPVLWALNEISRPGGELCVPFKYIASTLGRSDVPEVRRVTRQLARKGLAEYYRGLFTDDGDMAGSGYCITEAGRAALKETGK